MRSWVLYFALAVAAPSLALAQSAQTFVYDVHGRLTGSTQIKQATSSDFVGYAYDAAGNRMLRRAEVQAPPAATAVLGPGEQMVLQQNLTSADSRFTFAFQQDGNLAIWMGSTLLWAANTYGTQALVLAMQTDGNLVLYGPNYSVVWSSGTTAPGSRLVMQDDGNLVIYDGWTPVWSSGTGGH